MTTDTDVRHCPFAHTTAHEFDPLLRRLRDNAPVARITMPHGKGWAWLVTRYDDVRTVVCDPRFSRARGLGRDLPRMTPEPIAQRDSINLMDPPRHTRLRRLVAQGLTASQVRRMEPQVRAIVDRLLDEMIAHGAPADYAACFAAHLPIATICEILAIPAADRSRIRRWALTLMATGAGGEADAGARQAREAKSAMRSYFLELAADRRRHPGDDLVSVLAAAREGDDRLDDTELGVMAMSLCLNGHDTSTYQLSNILYALLTRPDELALLRRRPELLEPALEELLRYIPFRRGVGIARIAVEDVELGGVTIRAGDPVHVSYLAANRDPDVFDRPDDLDLTRPPVTHMTFGHGTHYCAGANLARAQLSLALDRLLARLPDLRLAIPADQVPWHTGSIWRYPEQLPITW